MTIHLCMGKLYEYNGISFEVSITGQPWPLKLDGDPKKRAGRMFYDKIGPWLKMTDAERGKYRVGGGCQTIGTPEVKP